MNEKYFLIICSEDGLDIEQLQEEELLERISPNEDGEYEWYGELKFADKVPSITDGYWDGDIRQAVIIKGNIVVPIAKQVITKMELP